VLDDQGAISEEDKDTSTNIVIIQGKFNTLIFMLKIQAYS